MMLPLPGVACGIKKFHDFLANLVVPAQTSDPHTQDGTNLRRTNLRLTNVGPVQTSDQYKRRTKEKDFI